MKGYMWMKGHKADKMKHTIKKFLFNAEGFKRRFFILDNVKLELVYYADQSKTSPLGAIDLLSILSISTANNAEEMPSKYPLFLSTNEGMDWMLCCENEDQHRNWEREIAGILKRKGCACTSDASVANETRRDVSLSSPPSAGIKRTVMNEADYKNATANTSPKGMLNRDGSTKSKRRFSFKRRSTMNHSFCNEMQLQRERLCEESKYNSITGNVGILATATFSRFVSLENLEFYQVLMSSCRDDLDITSRHLIVTKFLDECHFAFFMKEGETIVTEGSKFEWVYFVLEGQIEQRKNWASSPNHIAKAINPGQCAGFVEALHFNCLSTTTQTVGPGTVCLKMGVSTFRKQFHHERGSFSSAMQPSSALLSERLTNFTYKSLSNLPLFQRQPTASIQEFSHIFSPVFLSAGDYLVKEGSSNNEFFIIIQGSCSVFQKRSYEKDASVDNNVIVHSCRGGDWVGEAALLHVQSRLSTVIAYSEVVALKTDSGGFKRFLDICGPSIREIITQSTTDFLRKTLKTIPLFGGIGDDQIVEICREVEIKELDPDVLLYDVGDKIEDLILVLHGHIKCAISYVSGLDLSDSPAFIDTMRENDFFGESSVLYGSTQSRLQYFTPKDRKAVVLVISAKKMKPFLPKCPNLQLRLEDRMRLRKTHMDLIDTLVTSISASLSARYAVDAPRGSNVSLGRVVDVTTKDNSSLYDEVQYLRDEVKRLNGVQYFDSKGRSQSKALTSFKSTIRRIKSSLPSTSARVPEKKKTSNREAAFEAAKFSSPTHNIDDMKYRFSDDEGDNNDTTPICNEETSRQHHTNINLLPETYVGVDSDSDDSSFGETVFSDLDYVESSLELAQPPIHESNVVKKTPDTAEEQLNSMNRWNTEKKKDEKIPTEELSKKTPNVNLSESPKEPQPSVKQKTPVSEVGDTAATQNPPVVDAMYERMVKMNLPEIAIRKKMQKDGLSSEVINDFFLKRSKS